MKRLVLVLTLLPALAAADAPAPCDDFYGYANAAWLAANPIPAGQSRWSRRSAGRADNQRRLVALLAEAAAKRDAPAGSAARVAGELYAGCMDEARDAAGTRPLAPLLAELDALQTPADVARALRRLHALGIPAGFSAAGAFLYHEPSRFVLNLAAAPRVATDDKQVAALEDALAEGALDPAAAADPAKIDHPTSFAELVALAPAVDWPAYFSEAGLPRGVVNVAEPRLLRQLDRALRETAVPVWRSYLRVRLLDAAAPYLSPPSKPRGEHCAELTEALLPDAVGELFVERHFPAAARARVRGMVDALRAELRADVAALPWMAPETRRRALDKLARYDAEVGAPHRFADHRGLVIRRDAFWDGVAAARRRTVDADRRRIGKPTDRSVWQLPASSSGAYIDVQLNQIVLPAGFLLALGFKPELDDAELYGLIGAGIAHDLTHAVDAGGAEFDAAGRPARWWSDADRAQFQARAACVDETYAAFEVEPGLRLDGKRVESEAVGDLGGVRLAYRALGKALAAKPSPPRDGLTAEQRFFVAWAQARAEALRPETEREMAKGDPHPPGRFRVLGTLVNLPELEQAFACKPGTKMVRPPETRCAIW